MSMIKFRNPAYREGGTEPKWIELPVYSDEYPGTMKYQGDVANYASLPSEANWGDVYTTSDTQNKYVFDQNNEWKLVSTPDAPRDNKTYARKDGQWVAIADITEIVQVNISTNQSDASILNGVKVTVTPNDGSSPIEQTYAGKSLEFALLGGVEYVMSFSSIEGYLTPTDQTFTAIQGRTRTINAVYSTSLLLVNLTSNQSDKSDIAGAKATVTYGGTTVQVSNGETIQIAPNQSVSVSFSAVSGYATPTTQTFTSGTSAKIITGTYNTTIVTVKMASNQSSTTDIASATAVVSASGISNTTVSNNGTVKVPTANTCTITWSAVSGYATPAAQTFTTSGSSVSKTGTYNSEFLTVNVGVDNGTLGAYTVSVSGIGSQTTTTKTYKIPYGTQYTISGSAVDGFSTPASQTFTAGQASRTVNMTYTQIVNGMFIYDTDGKLTPVASWNTANNSKAVGVAILTDDCRFVVAKEDAKSSYVYWGGYGTDISTLTNYTSDTNAATDFDGANNTSKIIAAIGNTNDGYRDGTAAGDCASYTFPNGKTGYLGAAGEWQVARQNKEDLNSALTLIGGTTMKESAYWTSTEYSSIGAWNQWFDSDSYLGGYTKSSGGIYVRAFLAL